MPHMPDYHLDAVFNPNAGQHQITGNQYERVPSNFDPSNSGPSRSDIGEIHHEQYATVHSLPGVSPSCVPGMGKITPQVATEQFKTVPSKLA